MEDLFEMKIMNHEIKGFVDFLMGFELGGKLSRMRTRFCKIAGEQLRLIEEERVELAKMYAKKDENDLPEIHTAENGTTHYILDNIEEFNREYQLLMLEEFVLEQTADKEEMLRAVRDMVLETDQVFKGNAALQYDRYCEIVEVIR